MSQLLQYYKSFQQQPRAATPTLQPTFEDLTIDDNLTELQRVVRYARSTIGLQRLVHVKMLSSVAKSVGFSETDTQILPLVEELRKDPEPVVRQHLLEQLNLLAQFCNSSGGEDGYQIVVEKLLPLTAKMLEDDKPDVRQSACAALVGIAKLIRPDDLGQHVLTIILRLSHEDDNEEMRMIASELLNSLAEALGQDLCKQFVIPEVVCLAEDPVFRVRKSTALNFHNICKIGGEHELFERLMPAFVRLSKDDMYRVRRACAESLSEIAKHVSDDIRVGVLLEIYLRLAQDPSKLVKQSILQQSGMFISALPPRAVNEMVLGHFCSMASGPTGDVSVDAELKHYCAYSFPGVLQTIGVERWGEVRELYHSLVQCRSANVKQTLAASLHEVARILSKGRTALVEEELVPVFEGMLQDVESVQMGVIKRLADFLSMLSEPCRISYLPLLHDILHSTNPFNWRLRQYLAMQLPELILLPPKNQVFMTLFPLMMTLLQDPVASVRRESFRGVARMVMILVNLVEETEGPMRTANSTATTSNEGTSSESSETNNRASVELQSGETAPTSSASTSASTTEQSAETIASPEQSSDLSSNSNTHNDSVSGAAHSDGNNDGNGGEVKKPESISATVQLEVLTNSINQLAASETYQVRQLWVELVHCFLRELPREPFEKFFVDGLSLMAKDKVSNVRVAVSRLLTGWDVEAKDTVTVSPGNSSKDNSSHLSTHHQSVENGNLANGIMVPLVPSSSPWSWLLRRPDIVECVRTLAHDDADIYLAMCKLQPMFPDIAFEVATKSRKLSPRVDLSSADENRGADGTDGSGNGSGSANTLPPLGVPLPILTEEEGEEGDAGTPRASPLKGSIFEALAHADANTDESLLRLEDIADTGFFPHRTPPGSGRSSRSSSLTGASPLVMPLSLPLPPSPLQLMESPTKAKYDDDEQEEDGQESSGEDDSEGDDEDGSEGEEEEDSEGNENDEKANKESDTATREQAAADGGSVPSNSVSSAAECTDNASDLEVTDTNT